MLRNIHGFLAARAGHEFKPRVIVQIIDLENMDLRREIGAFKEYWRDYDVELDVWRELSWGVKQIGRALFRYPCFSLWDSLYVNSDATVSPCCMDWRQELTVGDLRRENLHAIWQGKALDRLRDCHRQGQAGQLPLCGLCNYWSWLPRIREYPRNNLTVK